MSITRLTVIYKLASSKIVTPVAINQFGLLDGNGKAMLEHRKAPSHLKPKPNAGEDQVLSIMLRSTVRPGLCGHGRAYPVSIRGSVATGGIHLQGGLISSLAKSSGVSKFVSRFPDNLLMHAENREIWVEQKIDIDLEQKEKLKNS
ncbi:hypothetical protein BTVI_88160 [Pitangus sulphuratus]|nr:hypothetical protein BTVI_88160 [Pitangus sulphuratus]